MFVEDKKVHTFLKVICPKVNVIVRLEFELAYYDIEVKDINHYAARTYPHVILLHGSTNILIAWYLSIHLSFWRPTYLSNRLIINICQRPSNFFLLIQLANLLVNCRLKERKKQTKSTENSKLACHLIYLHSYPEHHHTFDEVNISQFFNCNQSALWAYTQNLSIFCDVI